MKPRYKSNADYTDAQRGRIVRIFALPLLFRVFVPFFVAWLSASLLITYMAKYFYPHIDNGDSFVVIVQYATGGLVAIPVCVACFVSYVRWIIRYRTKRRGRIVALRDVLKPTDRSPSWTRKINLRLYGLTQEDVDQIPNLWRESGQGK